MPTGSLLPLHRFVRTGGNSIALALLAALAFPRISHKDPPTKNVNPANQTTVKRWLEGASNNSNRLRTPMLQIVRLRKRNTGAVKSGESFSSFAASTGVFKLRNRLARSGQSPRSNNMLRKKTPNDDGMMIATC